ncbi:DUF3626 domain-containing protein [Vibrio sinaloensis]|nr:DUF3626 domain-containing protein [Vibrio sinaloensis]
MGHSIIVTIQWGGSPRFGSCYFQLKAHMFDRTTFFVFQTVFLSRMTLLPPLGLRLLSPKPVHRSTTNWTTILKHIFTVRFQ